MNNTVNLAKLGLRAVLISSMISGVTYAGHCPPNSAPKKVDDVIVLKPNIRANSKSMVRETLNGSGSKFSVPIYTPPNDSDGLNIWGTDCPVVLNKPKYLDIENCNKQDVIENKATMHLVQKANGSSSYEMLIINPGSRPLAITMDPTVDWSNKTINWLRGRSGDFTYYVLLRNSDTVLGLPALKFHKNYLVEVFDDKDESCRLNRPELAVERTCSGCPIQWPLLSKNSRKFELDVGGGHEPPRKP